MKIAIVKLSAMGDIIQSAFILQYIHQYFPNIKVDWIVEETFAPILQNNPHIHDIKTLNLKSVKKSPLNIIKEIKKIKRYAKNNYDFVIDFQANIKSAITSKLLCKNVYGFDKNSAREKEANFFYSKSYDIPYHLNTIDRYRLLLNSVFDINITKEDVLNKKPYLFYETKKSFSSEVVFIIGASWKSKIYPKERVKRVIQALDTKVTVPYSNQEEYEFAKSLGDVEIVKLNLDELKALISNVSLVIGNDTGPTYMAWANNIPSVVLFGPVPPNRVYSDEKTILFKSPSSVNPYKLNKNDFSIKDIDENQIISEAKRLLS